MIGLNSSNFYFMLTVGLIRLDLYHTSPQCSTRGNILRVGYIITTRSVQS